MDNARAPLVFVYKLRIACPVCRRKDGGCGVLSDRSRVLCWKVPSDNPDQSGTHWWHDWPTVSEALSDEVLAALSSHKIEETATLAPLAVRDAVYRQLLSQCDRQERERRDLIKRGFKPDGIPPLLRSVPTMLRAVEITTALASEFDLSGVPGFYASHTFNLGPCNDECFYDEVGALAWSISLSGSLTFRGGLLIPYISPDGLIQAVQIRRNGTSKNKYIWLSAGSVDLEKHPDVIASSRGKADNKPAHYANVAQMKESGEAYIVEGGLKAEVASYLSGVGVIGFGGLHAPADFTLSLVEQLPQVRTLHLCFDADWRQNVQVKRAVLTLSDELRAARFQVNIASWSAMKGKGFDDYLLALREERREAA